MKLSDSKKAQRRERVRRQVGWRRRGNRVRKLARRKSKGPSRGQADHDFLIFEAETMRRRSADEVKRLAREARQARDKRLREIERQEYLERLEAERAEAARVFEECRELVEYRGLARVNGPKPSRWARFKAWWRRLLRR